MNTISSFRICSFNLRGFSKKIQNSKWLTLIHVGGAGRNHHTPSKNRVFLRNATSNEFAKICEFLKIASFDILSEILIPQYGPNFGPIDPIFFCCLIIENNNFAFEVMVILDLKITCTVTNRVKWPK